MKVQYRRITGMVRPEIWFCLVSESGGLATFWCPVAILFLGYIAFASTIKEFLERRFGVPVEISEGDAWDNVVGTDGLMEHPATGTRVCPEELKFDNLEGVTHGRVGFERDRTSQD